MRQEAPALKTQKEKVSYSVGVDVAKSFAKMGMDLDIDVFIKGLKDGFSGKKTLMTDDEMHATMTAFQNDMMKKQSQGKQTAAEENKKVGEAFLAENKKKEGVVALPSGLQYKILKAGKGQKPTAADKVECHYRGTLIDGTEFDSSYRRGQPATFPVEWCYSGMDRGIETHARGLQVAAIRTLSSSHMENTAPARTSAPTLRSSSRWNCWGSSKEDSYFKSPLSPWERARVRADSL